MDWAKPSQNIQFKEQVLPESQWHATTYNSGVIHSSLRTWTHIVIGIMAINW
jgi:hypothetical protein